MWRSGAAVHAEERKEELVRHPLTKHKLTWWQLTTAWARQRPILTTFLSLLAAGIIIAVIVGPVVGTRSKDGKKDIQDSSRTEYKLTFEAKDAQNVCVNFTETAFLSSYGASLRSSIALVIGIDASLVEVRTLQCGSNTFQWPGTGRRLLAENTLELSVAFRLATPVSSSQALPSVSSITAALQSDKGRQALVQAVSKSLALPASSIAFVGVVAAVITLPPPAPAQVESPSPFPPPPAPPPPPISPPPVVIAAPPSIPVYGGEDDVPEGSNTPTFPTAVPPSPPRDKELPVYGDKEHQPS